LHQNPAKPIIINGPNNSDFEIAIGERLNGGVSRTEHLVKVKLRPPHQVLLRANRYARINYQISREVHWMCDPFTARRLRCNHAAKSLHPAIAEILYKIAAPDLKKENRPHRTAVELQATVP
jgi:hypothetical protein